MCIYLPTKLPTANPPARPGRTYDIPSTEAPTSNFKSRRVGPTMPLLSPTAKMLKYNTNVLITLIGCSRICCIAAMANGITPDVKVKWQ